MSVTWRRCRLTLSAARRRQIVRQSQSNVLAGRVKGKPAVVAEEEADEAKWPEGDSVEASVRTRGCSPDVAIQMQPAGRRLRLVSHKSLPVERRDPLCGGSINALDVASQRLDGNE